MRITTFTLILLISTPLLHTAGALRLALTRTATPFAVDCPIFMPGSTPEMQPWRYHSTRRPLAELLAPYEKGLKNMDPALKKVLRTSIPYRSSDRENKERLRTALIAKITGRAFALKKLESAISKEDHELVADLLESKGRQKIHGGPLIDKAARTNNLETLAHVLKHSYKNRWEEQMWQWGSYSAETIKFLLAHGAKIPQKISFNDRTFFGYRYPSDAIFGDIFCSAFARAYWQDPKMYDVPKKAELLKKAIILASNGDPFSFQVNNPMSWEESKKRGHTSYTSRVSCSAAEGDWTFGAFPDLATLTQALAKLKKGSPSKKVAAQATVKRIMEQYDITDEEVTAQSKVEKKHRAKTRKKAGPSDEPRNEPIGGF